MFDEAAPGTDRRLLTRTSSGLDMLQWRSGSSLHVHAAERKLLELPLIDANPIRIGGQWQNRPNRHGQYYWAPTGRHVWHESALEAACLMGLEEPRLLIPGRRNFWTDRQSRPPAARSRI